MSRLLKFEFHKLKGQKSYYICCAALVAMLLLNMLTYYFLDVITSGVDGMEESLGALLGNFSFSGRYFLLTSLSGSDIYIILSVFIALFVCTDFSEGTVKNIISRGFSRTNVNVSKYATTAVGSVVMTIVGLTVSFGAGCLLFGLGDGWCAADIFSIAVQLCAVIAYSSIFTMVAVWLRKTGAVIAVGIVVPLVMSLILTVIDAIIKSDTVVVSRYWLSACFPTSVAVETSELVRSLICAAVYICAAVVAGLLMTRKRDI